MMFALKMKEIEHFDCNNFFNCSCLLPFLSYIGNKHEQFTFWGSLDPSSMRYRSKRLIFMNILFRLGQRLQLSSIRLASVT